jgi:hypothetical protein
MTVDSQGFSPATEGSREHMVQLMGLGEEALGISTIQSE